MKSGTVLSQEKKDEIIEKPQESSVRWVKKRDEIEKQIEDCDAKITKGVANLKNELEKRHKDTNLPRVQPQDLMSCLQTFNSINTRKFSKIFDKSTTGLISCVFFLV